MRKIFYYFLILLASIWLGVKIAQSSGYVLFAYKTHTIETTLWVAIIAILVLFFLLYICLRFLTGIFNIPKKLKNWYKTFSYKKSYVNLVKGFYAYAEGNWRLAEKKLLRAAKNNDIALLNYLVAASCAQKQKAFDRCDEYLSKAQNGNVKAILVVGLTQARLHMANKHWERALAVLQNLRQIKPRHILLLKLLQQVYFELHDWNNLKDLLPILRRRKVLSPDDYHVLELNVYQKLLQDAFEKEKYVELEMIWKKIPWRLIWEPNLLVVYVDYLIANSQNAKAEKLLKKALHTHLDAKLLHFYSLLQSANPIKQLKRAERWYKSNEDNQLLLLCLGRLCRRQKLWGKARFYLEKSLKLVPTAAVYNELGNIMEEQGEKLAAFNYYKMAANYYSALIPATAER